MTMQTTNETDAARDEHAMWLAAYHDQVAICQPPMVEPNRPLTTGQIEAYRSLPDLIDQCRAAWEAIPESHRPSHYLLNV